MTVKVYAPSEQKRIIEEHVQQGSYRLAVLLHRRRGEVIKMAVERSMGIGLVDYGDKSFHKSLDMLEEETMQELSDGVVYQSLYSWKEHEGIRSI